VSTTEVAVASQAQTAGGEIELLLLGPVEVRLGGARMTLGGAKPTALLADLALHLGQAVSVDRLVEDLWGEDVPGTAGHAVQVYVSQLRKALGPALIVTRPPGYMLALDPSRSDVHRFSQLVDEGRASLRAGDAATAAGTFREALALRRGPALADFTYEPFAQLEIARLEELQQACLESRIEADLALGRHSELVPELEALVAAGPLRERPRAQLMLALYRCGRQVDALAAYRDGRRVLVDELGITPGPELRDLEAAILRQDTSLDAPPAPAGAVRLPAESRKLVTVVVAGVDPPQADAALDPEELHHVLDRYATTVASVVEQHGGSAQMLPSGAVLAVFGAPVAHEDDALRAARAALELRSALAAHPEGLAGRIGMETGEVLVGADRSVTGGAVGAATLLQDSAPPGEIAVGGLSARLIGHAARLEPLDSGGAFRLIELDPAAPAVPRRLDAPLVGRERELVMLREALDRVRATRSPEGVLLVGPAGIGKSRLASELSKIEGDARILTGRCPSYGEGLTYWPLRTGVLESVGATTDEGILALVAGEGDADRITAALSALGAGEDVRSAGEIAWAFRRLCETLAQERPLVLVLDDLHWAEPGLLDLVEHVVAQSTNASLLVVCLARDELLEERPALLEQGRIALAVLSDDDTESLVDGLLDGRQLGDDARAELVATAGGNPLFLEQLMAFVVEEGGAAGRSLPATIRALLAARLDRLGPGERAVLERAAIVGRDFQPAELAALIGPAAAGTIGRHLQVLAARGFVREGSGFRHVLIQEAVYRGMPKETRARLHERFADWLERNQQGPELDELAGFHLERAYRFRVELGQSDRSVRQLATDAGRRLGSGGMRTWRRSDAPAAVNLLGRATDLLPDLDTTRLELLCELGIALRAVGETERSDRALREAAESSARAGDGRIELRARLELAYSRTLNDRDADVAELLDLAGTAIPTLETLGDDRALGRAWLLAGFVQGGIYGRHAAWEDAAGRALVHYRRARFPTAACLGELAAALYYGPTPAPEAIRRCEDLLRDEALDGVGEANVRVFLAGLEAMCGCFAQARELVARADVLYADLGQSALAATYGKAVGADVEFLAGDLATAERLLRELCLVHEQMRNWSALATRAADLAEVLFALGCVREAEQWSTTAERRAQAEDMSVQPLWRGVRAKLLADRGVLPEAERLARRAVGLADGTDALNQRARVRLDLAHVLRRAGQGREASDAVEEAVGLYAEKGNVVAAKRARTELGVLT
jgi:DNA-binding SARP family transcriptional activator/tetratricopeptide (TPR) repeat protein